VVAEADRLRGFRPTDVVEPNRDLAPFRHPLPSGLAPEEAVLWLRGDERPFALCGDWFGGLTVLGSAPVSVADPGGDPFALLDREPQLPSRDVAVGGGWVGWWGFHLGARIEELPPPPPAPLPRPPFSLAFYDHVVLFDGERWWFEALCSDQRRDVLRERLALWEARLQAAPPPAQDVTLTPFTLAGNGVGGHVSAVDDCCRRIAAGDLFQANICLRLQAQFDGDPIDLFARALPRARPRFGAFVDGVVSLSPERFLRRDGRCVRTEPIKGTRPRVGPEGEMKAALGELLASAKDAAEHVMIVDLMRNDLGRVCAYGTIGVDPPRAEPHAGVWHLVSTVHGQLREGVGDGGLLRATFPPGSVTGAPKVQAMKVISELEATAREVYTGAIGISSPVAGLDLNVAIRTFELSRGSIWMGAGGGIVADSDPQSEYDEAIAKASGPIAAIGGRLVRQRPIRVRPVAAVPDALRYGRRPDADAGVFETVLVERGRAVLLDEHLRRLAAALEDVYGSRLAPDVDAVAADAASRCHLRSRLRILADPDGSIAVTVSPAPPRDPAPTTLTPFLLRGGLGARKWRDRGLIDALHGIVPGTVPLFVDADGLVLEAAHANVWIVEGDNLITPPTDGRILPGVTRAEILSAAGSTREESIDLDRLMSCDEVFLSSSLSLRHPARLAGLAQPGGSELDQRVFA
jgi:para-aminobenzoate synthetase/4-amino-4-deoxychorismate lyase